MKTKRAFLILLTIVLLGSIFGVIAVQINLFSNSTSTSAMHLDSVPNNSEFVVYANNRLSNDTVTNKILSNVSSQRNFSNMSYLKTIQNASGETGLNVKNISSATAFGTIPNSSSATSDPYVGVILDTDWDETGIIGQFKQLSELEIDAEDITKKSYNSHTVYVISENKTKQENINEQIFIGVLNSGRYVVGTEQATKDSIDAFESEGSRLDGSMRKQLQSEQDNNLAFAFESQQLNVDTPISENIHVISGSYDTKSTDTLTISLTLQTNGSETADQTKRQIDGGLALFEQQAENETVKTHLQNIDVKQEKTTVRLTYQTTVAEFNTLFELTHLPFFEDITSSIS